MSDGCFMPAFDKPAKPKDAEGRALVVVAHGMALALCWAGSAAISEFVSDHNPAGDGFWCEHVDHELIEDGVWIVEMVIADAGASDWPGSREYELRMINARRATREEWEAHGRGDWPWEMDE